MVKRPRSHVLEDESRKAFEELVPSEWIVRQIHPDYGLDLEVVIVEGEDVSNKEFRVQLKATDDDLPEDKVLPFSMKTKSLKYLEGCQIPVILAYWVRPHRRFYYLFVQKYINEELSPEKPDWRDQKTVTLHFTPDSRLTDYKVLNSVAIEGLLYVQQKNLNLDPASKGAFYFLNGIPHSQDQALKEQTLKALMYASNEKHNLAIAEYEGILRTITTSPTERMSVLINLGNAYLSISRNDKAINNYEAVLELSKNVSEEDALEGRSIALGNIGVIYIARGDLDSALKYHQDALEIDKKIGYRQGEANQLGNIGIICSDMGDLDSGLKYMNDALEIDREIGYRQGEASDLSNIGLIYSKMGDLDTAFKYINDALEILREVGYRQGEASALANIGLIYCAKGNLGSALKYHQGALEIHREVGYRQGEANQLGNIGLIYRAKGDLDSALKDMNDALEIHREVGYRQGEASDLGNIGLIYSDMGDLDSALEYRQDALEINIEIGYRQGEASELGNIGLIYRTKGDLDSALKYLNEALGILDKFNLVYGRDVFANAIEEIQKEKNQK